jgi:hypothetical protein
MEEISATIIVFGSLILLLLTLAIISWWRKGSKYAQMENAYRERKLQAEKEESKLRSENPFFEWDFDEEESPEKESS